MESVASVLVVVSVAPVGLVVPVAPVVRVVSVATVVSVVYEEYVELRQNVSDTNKLKNIY